MKNNESVDLAQKKKKHNKFLKKQLKDLLLIYLDSPAANDQKDRQHKLYVCQELQKLLKS